jgi:hypothetical protein
MLLNGLAKVVTVNPLINVDEITEITLELITNAV